MAKPAVLGTDYRLYDPDGDGQSKPDHCCPDAHGVVWQRKTAIVQDGADG